MVGGFPLTAVSALDSVGSGALAVSGAVAGFSLAAFALSSTG